MINEMWLPPREPGATGITGVGDVRTPSMPARPSHGEQSRVGVSALNQRSPLIQNARPQPGSQLRPREAATASHVFPKGMKNLLVRAGPIHPLGLLTISRIKHRRI